MFAFKNVFALRGTGRVLRNEQLEANAAIRLVQQRALPARQQHDKLQKGVAEFFVDELELEPLYGHGPPQIDLNPPPLDGIARVRLPERGWIAVENAVR